jgi:hypothetical protein
MKQKGQVIRSYGRVHVADELVEIEGLNQVITLEIIVDILDGVYDKCACGHEKPVVLAVCRFPDVQNVPPGQQLQALPL